MNKSYTGVALLAALAGCAWGASASAAAGGRFKLQLNGEVTYDSNVARSDEALAALRGIKPSDVIFTPTLEMDILQPVSRESVFLNGLVGYDFYDKNHVLNNARLDLHGGVNGQLSRCKGTFTAGYARHQSDLQYLTLAATKNVEEVKSVTLDGDCGRRIGLAPTFSVSQVWSDESARVLATSSFRALTATVGMAYRRPSFGELSAYVRYNDTTYPDRNLLTVPGLVEDGFKSYSGGARYERKLGAKIELAGHLGYTSLKPNVAGLIGFDGATYGADISVRPSSRIKTTFKFDRSVNPSDRPDTTYSLDEIYSLEGLYSASQRLQFTLGGSQATSHLRGSALISGLDLADERVRAVYGSVRLQMGRRLFFTLDARREVRNANIVSYNYGDTRVGLSVSAAF